MNAVQFSNLKENGQMGSASKTHEEINQTQYILYTEPKNVKAKL